MGYCIPVLIQLIFNWNIIVFEYSYTLYLPGIFYSSIDTAYLAGLQDILGTSVVAEEENKER